MKSKGGEAKTVSIALTGKGGSGVMTVGEMLLDAAARTGWHGIMTRSLGPQVRGGEAAAFVRLGPAGIGAYDDALDILFALDWDSINRFSAELALGADTVVISDSASGAAVPAAIVGSGCRQLACPLTEIAKATPGSRINMVVLGIAAELIGLSDDVIVQTLERKLRGKDPAAVTNGAAGVRAGREAAKGLGVSFSFARPAAAGRRRLWSISGNEAVGLGALCGGVRFAAAYPITPATEILEWIAPRLDELGGSLVQAEDELASINAVVGASFGGTPAMTATSGPGFSLMQEGLGLAVETEVPMVVVDVMRCGPSTGIPTKSEQSDLNIALYGQHGDAPHLVTAPNAPEDCLFTTQWSVFLAEALQCPAVILTDQMMGQARVIVDELPESPLAAQRQTMKADSGKPYERYALTESGISPMAIPGMPGGEHETNSTEHNSWGAPTNRFDERSAQMDKRLRKLTAFDYGEHWADIEGDGDIAIVTWGSCTALAREAIGRAREAGLAVRLISIRLLSPPQVERFAAAIDGIGRIMVLEQSHGQQFHRYLWANFHDHLPRKMLVVSQPGPLPLRPGQVLKHLVEWS